MEKEKFSYPVSLRRMQITDKFWKNEMELVRTEVIPYQWNALNDKVEGAAPSYCMHNFKVAAEMNRQKRKQLFLLLSLPSGIAPGGIAAICGTKQSYSFKNASRLLLCSSVPTTK